MDTGNEAKQATTTSQTGKCMPERRRMAYAVNAVATGGARKAERWLSTKAGPGGRLGMME